MQALEILTGCYILVQVIDTIIFDWVMEYEVFWSNLDLWPFWWLCIVQGNTVAAMGSFKGLKQVRRIVEDCIHNKMHPVYHIKVIFFLTKMFT